jgi:glycosyltransferase involved in cell wall biosynthesis
MKLAFVTPWYGEFAGGAEVIVREAAECLAKGGIDVEVLTTCVRSPFDSWWKNQHPPGTSTLNNVLIRRFLVNTGAGPAYRQLNDKLVRNQKLTPDEEKAYLTASINSDALVSFVRDNKSSYVFFLSPYLYGVVYWACRAAPDRCILLPCLHDEPQAYFHTTRELLGCKKVLFKSQEEMELAEAIRGDGGSNFAVLGDGVHVRDHFDVAGFRARHKLRSDYLLFVGRKDKGKNIHLLVDYFDRYKKTAKDDLRLVFVGGGDKSLVPDRDYFLDLGFLDEDEKYNAYAGALATCTLSRNEAFSLVLMESWLASRPVIAAGGCPVTSGHCRRSNGGLYVENVHEFIEVLRLLKQDPGLAQKMGKNGHDYVLDHYTWDRVIRRYIRHFKEFDGDQP